MGEFGFKNRGGGKGGLKIFADTQIHTCIEIKRLWSKCILLPSILSLLILLDWRELKIFVAFLRPKNLQIFPKFLKISPKII